MNGEPTNMTVEAATLQQLSDFTGSGWVKAIAPAKVNLVLAVGPKQADGYHDVLTVMHALNLHDVVYVRRLPTESRMLDSASGDRPYDPLRIELTMLARGDIKAPEIPAEQNTAYKAVKALARLLGRAAHETIEIRIEKNIPDQAGLAGGSSDAAAALCAAAHLWGLDENDPHIAQAAKQVGTDVAFFLYGGCALLEGRGATFVRALEPSKASVALVRPDAGVSTAEAYRAFDAAPEFASDHLIRTARSVAHADSVPLFNNLAEPAERLLGQLAQIRKWLIEQPGVRDALLCGSGSATFAVCDDFATATSIVTHARQQGLWARATSFGSIKASLAVR